jgi:hypothetical protein
VRRLGLEQWGAQARVREHEIVVDLRQNSLLASPRFLFTQGVNPTPDGGDMLPDVQIQALNQRRVDLPAVLGQDCLDRLQGAQHHPMTHPHQTPPAHRLDPLRIEPRRQGPPAGLRRGAGGLVAWWLDPGANVGQERSRLLLKAVGQTQRHTAWSPDLGDLMDHALRHRACAFPALHGQEPLAHSLHSAPRKL